MKQLIEYKLKDETPFLIEVETGYHSRLLGAEDVFFDNAIKKIKPIAKSIIDEIRTVGGPGDEIEVELGLGFCSNADIFIAQAGANASITLRITLNKSQ